MTLHDHTPHPLPKHPMDDAARRAVEHDQRRLLSQGDVKHTHHKDDHGRFADDGCPHHSEE